MAGETPVSTISKSEELPKPIDPQDPLYVHPGDGYASVKTATALAGASNYREWKREMELCLATKRKLDLVTGRITKSKTDPMRAAAWETCNSLVISWLLGSMEPLRKKSVMYYTNCKIIWDDLESRFTKSNGVQKFKLNKATYETNQNNRPISEFYTELKSLWEEIEALTDYPPATAFPAELMNLTKFMDQQNEERRLFQFLNGLDQEYSTVRSNILMMSPLPTVETAFSFVQQEEDLAKPSESSPMAEV